MQEKSEWRYNELSVSLWWGTCLRIFRIIKFCNAEGLVLERCESGSDGLVAVAFEFKNVSVCQVITFIGDIHIAIFVESNSFGLGECV